MKKKIAVLAFPNESNRGDQLIIESFKYLYEHASNEDVEWIDFNLAQYGYMNEVRLSFRNRLLISLYTYSHKVSKRLPNSLFFYWAKVIFLALIFMTRLNGVNRGIIAGGGVIHYMYHDYACGIAAFSLACRMKSIPLIFHAVGVEGYSEKNVRCKVIKKVMKWKNVSAITVREGLDVLVDKYLDNDIGQYQTVTQIADPAIFSSEVYGIEKKQNSSKIGIGLIRLGILKNYSTAYDAKSLCDYYFELVRLLEDKGIDYEFFINGFSADLEVVPLLEEKIGRAIDVKIPNTAQELVHIVSRYSGIITSRMHSCIVAYSLGIPAVAFIWTDKLRYWGNTIRCPQNFIEMRDLSAELAYYTLENAAKTGYDEKLKIQLKESHIQSIKSWM